MWKKGLAVASIAAVLLTGAAAAQTRQYRVTIRPGGPVTSDKGFAKINVSRAAAGTDPIVLWQNTALDPDCSAQEPGATLTVLQQPEHGTLKLSDEPFFPGFPGASSLAHCNGKRVSGHRAIYTAQAGFTGKDKVVLQGAQPSGTVREIRVDTEVR